MEYLKKYKMKPNSAFRLQWLLLMCILLLSFASCKTSTRVDLLARPSDSLRISSSDTLLVNVFNWARKTSDGFVGKDSDTVGPWYEAALPGREAFCIRDVSHQCIGAEILWQGKQNLNMFRRFVENISAGKDYCSYWEINRYNKPAPVDYASDDDFWYNLNANFDIIDACCKLYEWTGNKTYLSDSIFDSFFRLTLNQYVDRWQLQADRIMDRPALMNRKPRTRRFAYARGIPSYDESQDGLTVSGDLMGMIYNGFRTYAQMLNLRGDSAEAHAYAARASQYKRLIDSLWWDPASQSYYGFYKTDRKFYPGGTANSEFLLWYGAMDDPARIVKSLRDIRNSQVEVLSYLPMLYYRYGLNAEGYDFLGKIYTDKRRNYPEASAAAMEGIVRGMMGIQPEASEGRVVTCPRFTSSTAWATVENIPVFCGLISVSHQSQSRTLFANKSGNTVNWRAVFQGNFPTIKLNGQKLPASHFRDATGQVHSYADVVVPAGSQAEAEATGE